MIIVWKGYGLFVAAVGFVCLIGGLVLGQSYGIAEPGLGYGLIAAGAANWALCRWWIYRKPPPLLVDPRTGHQRSAGMMAHTLFFIPAKAWTFIYVGIGVFGTFIGYSAIADNKKKDVPGYSAFHAADALILSSTGAESDYYGSNRAAELAAASFSNFLKGSMEGSPGGATPAGKPKLPAYCHCTRDAVVFLCKIPDLQRYQEAKSKEELIKHAWEAAKIAAHVADPEATKPLIIGLRGLSGYSFILSGGHSDEKPALAGDSAKEAMFYPPFSQIAARASKPQS